MRRYGYDFIDTISVAGFSVKKVTGVSRELLFLTKLGIIQNRWSDFEIRTIPK
ncbi:MAG TPA: hypothetical protein VJL89_05065 [Thermodesulfovibrionia bacterium]|nr:hypothetical protein [Thermodesulfovibrionia bacterium]